MSNEEIERKCRIYEIENYTINNGVVDVEGYVNFEYLGLHELPLKFGSVSGNFDCTGNKLTSLEGCPDYIGGNFFCGSNDLTSLEYCPSVVKGNIDCCANSIENLDHFPSEVGGWIRLERNPIGSILYLPSFELVDVFRKYKVIKNGQVILKRLMYVMSLFDRDIGLDTIKKHYRLIG
jgi:hypothetical protein